METHASTKVFRSSLSRTPSQPLIGFCGRLDVAAQVLADVRAFATSCRGRLRSRMDPTRHLGSIEVALLAYEDGRWGDAFHSAVALADAGDASAAKLALLMLRHGARVYGVAYSAEPSRVACWAKVVLEAKAALQRSSAAAGESYRTPRPTSRRTASPSSITAMA